MNTQRKIIDRVIFDAKVSERKILLIPAATIRFTPYNPPARTKEGAKLAHLIETIKEHGLIYPLLITSDRELIDGNRRLTACLAAGLEFVECIVSPLDGNKLFNAVNTSAVPMGGKGWIHVARAGGKPPVKEASTYKELHGLIGDYGIDLLIRFNVGLNILPLCKQAASFGTTRPLAEIILLTASKKLSNKLNAVIRGMQSSEEKRTAIESILKGAASA